MRLLLPTLIALLIALSSLAEDAEVQPDDPPEAPLPVEDPLDKLNVSVNFKKAPLDEVLQFLGATGGVEFVLSEGVRDELADGGMKIELKLDDLPLKSVLRFISGLLDLSISSKDGTLLVETNEEHGRERKRVEIDVRDLLMKIPDFPGPDLFPEEHEREREEAECVVFDDAKDRAWSHPDKFVDLIWKSTGQVWWEEGASMSLKNGVLILVHNSEAIKQVEELLSALRQFR
ncbi:MAG: hypothetical protein FD180_2070 [Planctomycetota bacterium]|nr:MAG: hypothetical protein FD180_2070 [Planctomycetota bacterium]